MLLSAEGSRPAARTSKRLHGYLRRAFVILFLACSFKGSSSRQLCTFALPNLLSASRLILFYSLGPFLCV